MTLSALEAHLGYWMRRISNEVSGAFARRVQSEGVSIAEWVALRILHDGEHRTPGELAAAMGMTRGALTKIVDKLDAKLLLTRAIDPNDARSQLLALTSAGRRLLARLARHADENDAHYFGALTTKEQAQLRCLLEKLVRAHDLRETPVH